MLFKHRLLKTIQIISRENKDDAVLYFVAGTCLQSSSSPECRTALPFAIWQVAVSLHWVGCGIFPAETLKLAVSPNVGCGNVCL